MDKKRIEKEWFLFIGMGVFGLVLLPALFYGVIQITNPQANITLLKFYNDFYESLGDNLFVWILLFSPYILVQSIRSIIWAIKAMKSEN